MNTAEKQERIRTLSPIEYFVTQEAGTERPFTGKYNDHYEPGIYVDVVSKEPLFLSTDKFSSGCGWPAFSKPIENSTRYIEDHSHGMNRVEVRSVEGNSHLGHVFNDGPKDLGGLRYCINSASLEFIPYDEMDEKGYGKYKKYVNLMN